MGVAQAGVAFRPKSPIENLTRFVSELLGEEHAQIPHPNVREFDIRHAGDVMVQDFEGTLFICSHHLSWGHLADLGSDIGSLQTKLASPTGFVVFCNYDSGGSYGYAIVENGLRTRSRLQTTGAPGLPPLLEYGAATDTEQLWLSSPSYLEEDEGDLPDQQYRVFYRENPRVDVGESQLTEVMLREILVAQFGVCPWDTKLIPVYYFFRAVSAIRASAQSTEAGSNPTPDAVKLNATATQRQPWWKAWLRR